MTAAGDSSGPQDREVRQDRQVRQVQIDKLRSALAARAPERTPLLGTRPAAVLVPLLPHPDGARLLFTERSRELRTHAGQVSFPGGSIDAGETELAAALREAREEVGLDEAHVEILGQLDDCPTFVTGFVITPFVGVVHASALTRNGRYPWAPSAAEIASLHELPLDAFLAPENLRIEERVHHETTYQLYWYTVSGTVVWGATARIVHQLAGLWAATSSAHEETT